MNEMRFGQSNRPFQSQTDTQPKYEVGASLGRPNESGKVLKLILIILVLAAIAGGVWFWKQQTGKPVAFDPTGSEYYGVFLSNGQVYFGKPVSKTKNEFVLSNVYYLQVSGDGQNAEAQLNEPKFSLVKLGKELHGPTDKLFLNMANVLFYEQLKTDSQVVQSIQNQK